MSSFHTKLRAFAVCQREAVQDAREREYWREVLAPEHTTAREARHSRKEQARRKHIAKHFSKRFAYWNHGGCIFCWPEKLLSDKLTQARRARYPSVNYGRISAVAAAWSPFEIASGATDRPEAPRCEECGIQHTPLTPEENFPDHPTLKGLTPPDRTVIIGEPTGD